MQKFLIKCGDRTQAEVVKKIEEIFKDFKGLLVGKVTQLGNTFEVGELVYMEVEVGFDKEKIVNGMLLNAGFLIRSRHEVRLDGRGLHSCVKFAGLTNMEELRKECFEKISGIRGHLPFFVEVEQENTSVFYLHAFHESSYSNWAHQWTEELLKFSRASKHCLSIAFSYVD